MIDDWDECLRNKANDDAYKVHDDNDAYKMFLRVFTIDVFRTKQFFAD